jgi:parvulin-like peptidyl-prolyl isomerase
MFGGNAAAGHKTIAKVNGTELSEMELQYKLDKIYPRAYFHRNSASSAEKRNALRPKALNNLIEEELLYQEAKRMQFKVDKQLIDNEHNNAIKRLGGKKAFKSVLKNRESTEKQYRKTIEKRFLVAMIIEKEVNQKSKVTDDEVAAYYDKNKESYVRPSSRKLWHVLIKVEPTSTMEDRLKKKARAEKVIQMAKEEGADLYQIAWDYSDGSFRVKGGDLGLVHEGRLESSVNEAAFSLQKGQISGVLESIYGYHIVKVLEIEKPKQLSLEDVSQKIKRELEESRLEKTREALISSLREKAVIEVYDEELKRVAED